MTSYMGLHWCGCSVIVASVPKFLPLISTKSHTKILSSSSHTVLSQTFQNPYTTQPLEEVSYIFPLYDGVTVVGFTCTIGPRVIHGVVKEKAQAKKDYQKAVDRGDAAGLLEQSTAASDVFKISLGNIPSGEKAEIVITYLGELKHDAEVDGLRFTIPTHIAPRYGSASSLEGNLQLSSLSEKIEVVVDAEMADGSAIRSVQSPSHPISVNIGTTSTDTDESSEMSLQKASATLSLGEAHLEKDFIIQIVATNLGNPTAVLETHPDLPNQRALMATLVPKFNIPTEKPEIVFICDRSGSMGVGKKIPNLRSALLIFFKSLPLGVKFNICSFGSSWSFLWERSRSYDQSSLEEAVRHVNTFDADFGGTEMYGPMEDTFKRRYKDMNLEVFLMTDGETWDQEKLFKLISTHMNKDKGNTRIFTLGVGQDASSSLIEGVARVGDGFAQTVGEDEKMDKKVVRMLKGALTPHIRDYKLEIQYESSSGDATSDDNDEDFEMVQKVTDAWTINTKPAPQSSPKLGSLLQKISLFDTSSGKDNKSPKGPNAPADSKYSHLPVIEEPRYLQAPNKIPTLFPFSRTTLYLLLSDASPHRKPKSVLLKGTSPHGELEIEIPISHLAEKGRTIHQLAARKAIQELEDGGGWLTQAKDKNGKLLKDKYDGQFSDMVEREAVRLGVLHQVAGKWTSFVAVENKGGDAEGGQVAEIGEERSDIAMPKESRRTLLSTTSWKRKSAMPAPPPSFHRALPSIRARRSGGGPPPAPMAAMPMAPGGHPPAYGAVPSTAVLLDTRSAPMDKKSLNVGQYMSFAGVGASGGYDDEDEEDEGEEDEEASEADGFAMSSKEESRESPVLSSRGEGVQKKSKTARRSVFGAAFGASPKPSTIPNPVQQNAFHGDEAAHERLAALQSFVGSWTWTESLEATLGIKKEDALKKKAALDSVDGEGADVEAVLATLCAVFFLKRKCVEDKDAWEMMVEKAEQWVEERTGKKMDELEKVIADLF